LKILRFLSGEREALRELGLNASALPATLTLLSFLIANALALSMLDIKIACSSSTPTNRMVEFVQAKQEILLYIWLIVAISWALSTVLIGRSVARRANMRLRKHQYLIAISSLPLAIAGIVNYIILLVSPGRGITCEGNSWKGLLLIAISEILSYLTSFPPILALIIALASLAWFTYLFYKIHAVTIGLDGKISLKYALAFTSTFIGLILIISILTSIFIVLLQ